MTNIKPDPLALIAVIREKWRNIALSTEPINYQKATTAIKSAYTISGLTAIDSWLESAVLEIAVKEITPEQQAHIPQIREKWQSLALSTAPIDRKKATSAVKAAYAYIGLSEPKIRFFRT